MESIYWVLTWACHRKCMHCYDDRFRPYVRAALDGVVNEGVEAYRAIIANLPDTLAYRDPKTGAARIGRIILAGGEMLLDPVRERLFYPVLESLSQRYRGGRARISIQTTGDLLTAQHIKDMLARGVWMIAISGMDDFHVGLEGEKRAGLMAEIRAMMDEAGVQEVTLGGKGRDYLAEDGPFFLFFGAQPGSWIGELWPRGRAFTNGLSKADYATNFCARQSGAKNFLAMGAGSEVAIEPDGSLYPCCLKTKLPLGNLTEERLTDILESLRGHPVFTALNDGDPERMGETFGWSRAAFAEASKTTTPQGEFYQNMCIGCDRFFEAKLGPVITALRAQRLRAQGLGAQRLGARTPG